MPLDEHRSTTPWAQLSGESPCARRTQGQRMKAGQRQKAKRQFLESYALQGLKMPPRANAACAAAGISRAALYHWLKHDPRFTAHYESLQAVYYPPWVFCPGALNDPQFDQERTYYRKQQRAGRRFIRYYQNRQAQR